MMRSFLAIAFGAAVVVVLMILFNMAISAVVVPSAVIAGAVAVVGSVAGALIAGGCGGYVCATNARAERSWHAVVLAALLLGVGIATLLRGGAGEEALALRIVFAVAAPVGVLFGARIRTLSD